VVTAARSTDYRRIEELSSWERSLRQQLLLAGTAIPYDKARAHVRNPAEDVPPVAVGVHGLEEDAAMAAVDDAPAVVAGGAAVERLQRRRGGRGGGDEARPAGAVVVDVAEKGRRSVEGAVAAAEGAVAEEAAPGPCRQGRHARVSRDRPAGCGPGSRRPGGDEIRRRRSHGVQVATLIRGFGCVGMLIRPCRNNRSPWNGRGDFAGASACWRGVEFEWNGRHANCTHINVAIDGHILEDPLPAIDGDAW
jgi:hypothetical protein